MFFFELTGASAQTKQYCYSLTSGNYCINLTEETITAEAGLCVVVPCSFSPGYYFTPRNIVWFKCDTSKSKCVESYMIFHTNQNKVHSAFKGRVTLLEPDVSQWNCSIIVNDLKESDSGLYQVRVNGLLSNEANGITFTRRSSISVSGKKSFNKNKHVDFFVL